MKNEQIRLHFGVEKLLADSKRGNVAMKTTERNKYSGREDTCGVSELMQKVLFFCDLASKHGINLVSGEDSFQSIERFNRLDSDRRREIIQNFSSYLDILRTADSEGLSLKDGKVLSWSAMRSLNVRPCSQFFDKINDGDIVECYNREHIQTFRNLVFFENCSYPVFDILVNEWPSLYERADHITASILREMNETMEPGQATVPFHTERHYMKEIYSTETRHFVIDLGHRAPLFPRTQGSRIPVGIILCLKATRIG